MEDKGEVSDREGISSALQLVHRSRALGGNCEIPTLPHVKVACCAPH